MNATAGSVVENTPHRRSTAYGKVNARRGLRRVEPLIEAGLFCAAAFAVVITVSIIGILFREGSVFFAHVGLFEFLTDTEWTPLFADAHYGILPLLLGTIVTSTVALAVAFPLGTVIAIYLSEYASPRVKEVIKPLLEILSAVPTVVYGYFALLFLTPMLQTIFPNLPGFNMLSAGIVMGVMIIPYVASLSEDSMRAVPMMLREGSYAMGASKLGTAIKVVIPAALSGIGAAYILGLSRAVGETMIVAVAAGMQPNFTFNPTEGAATITAFIVQVSLGDLPHGSIGYQSIFAAGVALFVLTMLANIVGHILRKKFRQVY